MLIALAFALKSIMFPPGLPIKDILEPLEDGIRSSIQQGTKQEQLLLVTGQMESVLKGYEKEMRKALKSLSKLNKSKMSTSQDFSKIFSHLNGQREQAQRDLIDLRLKLKSLLSQAEWEKIFDKSG